MAQLLKNERVVEELQPHPASFWPFYVFFLYYVVAGALIILYREQIDAWVRLTVLGLLGQTGVDFFYMLVWWGIIIVPALIFSVLRISWRWLILYTLLAVVATYAAYRYNVPPATLYYVTIGLGVLGVILTDLYRRSHKYILTNMRIISTLGFIGMKTRDVFYSRLTDVFVEQDLLGRIFNYGTVIPVTASGIGTGEDVARVEIGGGVKAKGAPVGGGIVVGGEKSVRVARGRSSFVVFGVPNPDKVRQTVLEFLAESESAPYLKKAVDLLEKIAGEKGEEEEGEEKK